MSVNTAAVVPEERNLFSIIKWVEEHGPPKSVQRMNLALGLHCVKERVVFSKVDATTEVSAALIEAAEKAAAKIVGKAMA